MFPLEQLPAVSWKDGMRRFMANRPNGRKHAGCDLYGAHRTPVLAVDDGVVTGFSYFYDDTWALTVEHADYTVRYGEIESKLPTGIAVGTEVKAGQMIGRMGLLKSLKKSMLHFEMYSGIATGPLTQRGNKPTQRRSDLIDPTPYLDKWAYALLLERFLRGIL